MADDGGEIIGGVGVSITGDYSALQTAFTDAQSKAQQAGEDIADSFNTGVAGVSDAGETVTNALSGVTDASDQAAGAITQVGESAGEANSSLAQMAEQLTAIGEALVVTEGLRELGSEALGASDSITRASIALTTMTGSGDTAHETIEGLEQLGMQDGLAMPSLLTAAQRMVAMLPPGTDVVALLGQIADGAAAMGTDVESAANRFDMIVNAGTLSARALTSLGLSLTSVAQAMNSVDPSADATTTSVTAMFKALDPGQRVAVLQQALQGLAGTAQQVAEQTFGGQWQQLADAWEQIMVQVGQALLPVISDLLALVKTDIAPFLTEVVTDFNALPGPVKDAAVAFAVALAAIIPVTGGLAAVGLAVNGLTGLIPAITGLMAAFGGGAEVAAAGAAGAATEVTALGGATGAAVGGAEGLAAAVGSGGIAGSLLTLGPIVALAILSIASLKDGYEQSKVVFDDVSDAVVAVSVKLNDLIDATGLLSSAASGLTKAWGAVLSIFEQFNTYSLVAQGIGNIANGITLLLGVAPKAAAAFAGDTEQVTLLKQALSEASLAFLAGAITADQYATVSVAVQKAQDTANASMVFGATATNTLNTTTAKATDSVSLLKQALADAEANLTKVGAAYQNNSASADKLIAAQLAVKNAQDNLNASLGSAPSQLDLIATQASILGGQLSDLGAKTLVASSAADVQTDKLNVAESTYNAAAAKVGLLEQAIAALTGTQNKSAAQTQELATLQTNLVAAWDVAQKDGANYQKQLDSITASLDDQAKQVIPQEITALQATATAVGPAMAQFLGLNDQIDALSRLLPNFGVTVTTLNTGPLAGLQSALNEASAKVADISAKMQAGANVGQQYEKALTAQLNAQVALDQESAVLGTGLQGATDATSLATVAVAAAQAKLDDLTAAYANGLATYSQVQSAQKALQTAQTELNTAIGAGNPLVVTQAQDLSGLLVPALQSTTGAATIAGTAITAVATAAQKATAEVTDLASSVQSIVSDFTNLSGAASAGGSVGGPAGYTASITYEPGTMGGGSEIVTWVPDQATIDTMRVAYEKQLYAQGYTPTGIAQMTTTPLATILTDLGLTAAQAGMTATGAGGSNSGAVLAPAGTTIPTGIFPTTGTGATDTTGGGATTGTAATGTAAPAGGAGTSAIDGGSYPAVTAHQATGEIWSVQDVGGSTAAGSVAAAALTQQITTTVNQTSTGASGGLVQSGIAGIVQTLSDVGTGLVVTLGTVAQAVAAVAQTVATAVGIPSSYLQPGSVTSGALPGVYSSNGARSSTTGLITDLFPSTGAGTNVIPNIGYNGATTLPSGSVLNAGTLAWLQQQITAGGGVGNEPSGLVGFYLPANAGVAAPGSTGNTFTVSVNLAGANFSAMSPAEIQQTIAGAVTTQLVTQLRAAGARF